MELIPCYYRYMFVYVKNTSVKRKSNSAKLAKAKAEHRKFLASVGYFKCAGKSSNGRTLGSDPKSPGSSPGFPSIPSSELIPTGGGFKHSIDDYKWKSGRTETKETVEAIEAKRKQIAPICNKGAYMLITDKKDWKTVGRKV